MLHTIRTRIALCSGACFIESNKVKSSENFIAAFLLSILQHSFAAAAVIKSLKSSPAPTVGALNLLASVPDVLNFRSPNMMVPKALSVFLAVAVASGSEDARATRDSRRVLQSDSPFLEAYWESWTSWPYDYDSCYTQTESA